MKILEKNLGTQFMCLESPGAGCLYALLGFPATKDWKDIQTDVS